MSAQLDEGAGRALGGSSSRAGSGRTGLDHDASRRRPWRTRRRARVPRRRHAAADLVVFAIGIRPRDELARDAGLELGPRGGIAIDDGCATSDPHIWAIGEVANFDGSASASSPRQRDGRGRGDRLLGGDGDVPRRRHATKLKLSGVDVASFGDALRRHRAGARDRLRRPGRAASTRRSSSRTTPRPCSAASSSATPRPTRSLRPLLGRELPREPAATSRAAAVEAPAGDELPDDALLCSCNNVTAGTHPRRRQRRRRRDGDGCVELGALKAARAPAPVRIVRAAGQEAARDRARRSPASRPPGPLRALRALAARSSSSRPGARSSPPSSEIIARFGTGRGCDICKPAIAIDPGQPARRLHPRRRPRRLQDTNDRALANMQKDGTYSVVPRIPGGEITPEKLAVIAPGRAATTACTRRSPAASASTCSAPGSSSCRRSGSGSSTPGFESGQAYGKALRNVKSLRRLHLVPLRRAGLGGHGHRSSSCATAACAPRTSSSSASRAAPASAPRPAARTSA